jgi:hypothetical protein
MHSGISAVYARGTQPNDTRCTAKRYEVHSGILGRIAARNGRLAALECEAPGPSRDDTWKMVDAPFRRRPVLTIELRGSHLPNESTLLKGLEGLGYGASIYAAFLGRFAAAESDSPVIAIPPIPVPIDSWVTVAMVKQEQQVNGV